jgi:aryl-alcohol dehydrogenase-like predicted oxidoreductase
MKTKNLGSTRLRVSLIGLGMAALGRPGYINLGHSEDLEENYSESYMEAHAHQVLDAAHLGGIIYFDAARSYGKAEVFLRSWLHSRDIPPDSVVIGSKWGYRYTAGWQVDADVHEVKEHSIGMLQTQWDESRSILGSYLKLYQIHSATIESGVLENLSVLDTLARLKAEGVAIGLTVSGPNQAEVIDQAAGLVIDGMRLFDTVQATWNLLERSAGGSLERASDAGLGVIIKEALANGRLTERNDAAAFHPSTKALEKEVERLHTTMDALAIAAVLARPWVDVVLSGAARYEHLQSNLGAMNVNYDGESEFNLQKLIEPRQIYWQKRAGLTWN